MYQLMIIYRERYAESVSVTSVIANYPKWEHAEAAAKEIGLNYNVEVLRLYPAGGFDA